MGKRGMNRRDFLKLTGAGSLAAATGGLAGGLLTPKWVWGAVPKVKGPIKIGYQAILSGTLAGYGEFHKMGAVMAIDEINAKGGIAGAKVEMDFRDSTTKADEAIKNARYFVDSWGADFLAGIDSSGQALALAPVMAQLDRVLMVTHGATEKLTEDFVYKKGIRQIFRNCMPTYNDGHAAAFIAKDFPAVKWATVSPKYEYGFTCWKMFQDTLKGLKPSAQFVAESFAPFGTTDFRSHINTIMDAKPDGLYSTEWAGELISFVRQAKEAGLFEKVKYVMFPVGAAMDVLEGLGKDMPDNLWVSARYFFLYPNNKVNNDWVARFHKRWKHYPAYVSRDGLLRDLRVQGGRGEGGIQGHEGGHRRAGGDGAGLPGGHAGLPERGPPGDLRRPLGEDEVRSEIPVQGHGGHEGPPGELVFQPAAVRGAGDVSAVQVVHAYVHVILAGLSSGMFIWLVASGLTLIFGVLGVLNFAHGSFYMLGAYCSFTVLRYLGAGFWAGLLLGPLAVCAVGFVVERFFLRHVYRIALPYPASAHVRVRPDLRQPGEDRLGRGGALASLSFLGGSVPILGRRTSRSTTCSSSPWGPRWRSSCGRCSRRRGTGGSSGRPPRTVKWRPAWASGSRPSSPASSSSAPGSAPWAGGWRSPTWGC